MANPTDDKSTFTCRARRHMRPSEYVTYEAMLAMAKSGQNQRKQKDEDHPGELVCHARLFILANANNRSDETEGMAIHRLVDAGWLIPLDTESQQRRWMRGRWASNRYRVVEHEEYAAEHGDCPPYKYDPDTGENLKKGTERRGWAMKWHPGWKRFYRLWKATIKGMTEAERAEWIEKLKR